MGIFLIRPALVLTVLIASLFLVSPCKSQPAFRTAVELEFRKWISQIKSEARAAGVSEKTLQTELKGVTLDWQLPDLNIPKPPGTAALKGNKKRQPEFDRPGLYFPESRLNSLTAIGRNKLISHGKELASIEKRFGVERSIVLAIWGRETAFGSYNMRHDAIQALATQAFMGARKDYFRKQLIIALKILDEGHVGRSELRSSWAGAMGFTQFLPSDFRDYAVDFDGDGRKDIWNSKIDALASAANALKVNGWSTGLTWGYEVRRPKDFDCTLEGPEGRRKISEWMAFGLTRAYDRKFSTERYQISANLLTPAGSQGPAFLVLDNFFVIKTYNFSNLYALYVGNLADRIVGGRRFEASWPTVDRFSRDEVRQMQTKLQEFGYNVGKLDGIVGPLTRVAIGRVQKKLGKSVTCFPTRSLLEQILRQDPEQYRR